MSPIDFMPKLPAVADNSQPQPIELPVVAKPVPVETPVVETKDTDLATLEEAAKREPKNVQNQIALARKYIELNERGLAISAANKATKLAPNSSLAWNTKGRAELNAKNYDNAIEAFTKAVELNQDNTYAWNNLGYTELLLKRYEDAVEHLTEATSKKDATGFMFNNLGTALEHLDKLDDARLAYEAGGKLGSQAASASRKRLDGVKTIVVEQTAKVEPKTKEYSLTDESSDGDETPPATDGEHSDDDAGSDVEPAPSDTATH